MNMQHTPGPWKTLWFDDQNGWVVNSSGIYLADIATEDGDDRIAPCGEQVANAELMAAAPDMLAALEYCLDSMTREYPHGMPVQLGRHTEEQDWNHATRTARAAIAKAKGGAA